LIFLRKNWKNPIILPKINEIDKIVNIYLRKSIAIGNFYIFKEKKMKMSLSLDNNRAIFLKIKIDKNIDIYKKYNKLTEGQCSLHFPNCQGQFLLFKKNFKNNIVIWQWYFDFFENQNRQSRLNEKNLTKLTNCQYFYRSVLPSAIFLFKKTKILNIIVIWQYYFKKIYF